MVEDQSEERVEETAEEFSRRVHLPFTDYYLLNRALTHRSYLNEHPEALEDNERLEFLGDAVLDFLVGAWLYNRFPEMPEGSLTRLRSALVRTEQLADFARDLNLGRVMHLGYGEAEAGGTERPALLCATFEAVIGALYLNSGIHAVQEFIHPILERSAVRIVTNEMDRDPKSILQEWAQAEGLGTPVYRTVIAHGPDHAKRFEVEVLINGEIRGLGVGSRKQDAAKSAAMAAITALGIE